MTTSAPQPAGVVYGIRLLSSDEYRYVGQTCRGLVYRFQKHLACARGGRKTPFYDWLRKQSVETVAIDLLEEVEQLSDLGDAEARWISALRDEGHRLLNISEGGLGPTGLVWTTEQREAARIRSTGRKGLSRPGEQNPFFGRTHSPEQRAKWSKERKGTYTGEANPNFGKFGPAHPGYGHAVTEETRRQLSEMKMGANNPNFGKTTSAETRAKLSAATKGVPRPASKRSAHTRHHTNKGVVKLECAYCIEDAGK